MSLKLHLLGEAYIEQDGGRMSMSFKKAEAILFYLALEGRCNKERVKCLFWGDRGERQASGNLRNALYLLRKALPHNFVSERGYLSLTDFVTDLEELDISSAAAAIPPALFEEPLCGFESVDSPDFSDWLDGARRRIRDETVLLLRKRLSSLEGEVTEDSRMELLSALLRLDPYDEESMAGLMELYIRQGAAVKALSLCRAFCERLDGELGVKPGPRLRRLARELAEETPRAGGHDRQYFCCREREVRKIIDLLSAAGGRTTLFFIHGEAGVGKTALVNYVTELLAGERGELFTACPMSVGEKFPYSSWNNIAVRLVERLREENLTVETAALSLLSRHFYGISDEESRGTPLIQERDVFAVGKVLAGLAARLYRGKPLFFIFEDMHWFDEQSLSLLRVFLPELRVPAAVFMTSRPESSERIIKMIYNIKSVPVGDFLHMRLQPFNGEEVLRFCRTFLSDEVVKARGADYFMRESEGMPLLLAEMVRMLRDNSGAECRDGLRGLIMSRMDELEPLQREMLSALSVFGAPAAIEDIAMLLEAETEQITSAAEELLRRGLICEVKENDDYGVDFLHVNVRECVYNAIPGFKRKQLHRRIAGILKRHYSPHIWSPALSAMLCHHHSMAGEKKAVLEQHLQEMSFHINLNHILFPMIRDSVLLKCSLPFSDREETEAKFRRIGEILQSCGAEEISDESELRRLEASYLEMYGGYKINWGEYEQGRRLTDSALEIAGADGFDEIAMHCLEDIAHHYLQTDRSRELSETGERILALARRLQKENHVGLALRLIGMASLIEGNYERAEEIFRESIAVFEGLELTGKFYTLSLLAPHCYIGEMRQWRGESAYAMAQFEYCIERCRRAKLFWGRSHFCAHAADTAIDLGDWQLAARHIDDGVSLFESSRGGHCSSLLYSLKAICDARRGDFDEAAASLKKADFLSAIGKKSWCAAQYMAKGWVGRLAAQSSATVNGCLDRPWEDYARAAVKLYGGFGAEFRAEGIRKEFGL